jgi:hypothetical protein
LIDCPISTANGRSPPRYTASAKVATTKGSRGSRANASWNAKILILQKQQPCRISFYQIVANPKFQESESMCILPRRTERFGVYINCCLA